MRSGSSRRSSVAAIIEEVAGDVLMYKVEKQGRIDGFAYDTRFEMKVAAGRASGVATEADGLTSANHVAHFAEVLGEVTVDGFKAVVVTDYDVVAVTFGFIVDDANLAIESARNGVADVHLDVETLVHTSEGGAVTVVGGDYAAGGRHGETSEVDAVVLGCLLGTVAMYCLGVPRRVELCVLEVDFCEIRRLLKGELFFDGFIDYNRVNSLHLTVDGSLSSNKILSLRFCGNGGHCCQRNCKCKCSLGNGFDVI